MINRLFIITSDVPSIISNIPGDNNVFFSWPVNPMQKENLEETYSYFSAAEKYNLSLLLEVNNPLSAEALLSVVSFLFLPSYLQIDECSVINVTGKSEKLLEETKESLSACALKQGFDMIIINTFLSSETNHPESRNWYFNDPEKLIQQYENILSGDAFYNNNIFLSHASLPDLKTVPASLQTIEKTFEKNNTKLFLLASDNIRLKKENRAVEIKHQLAENELRNQKGYADMLRSTHTTRQLQDFYNNEYEVLPGWYKRLGHIIKVITGKRTFKSLFNDKVKKYND